MTPLTHRLAAPFWPSIDRALGEPARIAARLGRVLGLLWSTHAPLTVAAAGLRVAESLLLVGMLYAGKLIIDDVGRLGGSGAGDRLVPAQGFWLLLALVAGSIVVAQAAEVVQTVLSELLTHDIRRRILTKAASLDYGQFESSAFYDKLSRAQAEAGFRPVNILHALLESGKALVTVAGVMALVARVNPWLGLGLVAASLPFLVSQTRHAYLAWRIAQWNTPTSREMGYIGFVLTDRQPAKEVRLFGFGPYLLDRHADIFRTHHARTRALSLARAGWGSATGLLMAAAFVGGAAYLAMRVEAGEVTVGGATVVIGALLVGRGQIQAFIGGVSSLYENNLFIDDLFSFLSLPPARRGCSGEDAAESEAGHRGIRFERTSFAYPGTACRVLHDIDLELRPGEIVALVGANGAGKTTLVKLLCGLYQPDTGRILLDGRDMRALEPQQVWERIAVNFQDYARYSVTVRENVGLGDIAALANEGRITVALRDANAAVIVDGLPRGLDTRLGRMFDDGHDLSDGQWQRIALARTFMKDAPILVLDEPTASADARAEYEFFERVRQRVQGQPGRMVLLISHRFGNVRMADRIYVMQEGRIVEAGAHEELVARGGVYADLFRLQAAGYQ